MVQIPGDHGGGILADRVAGKIVEQIWRVIRFRLGTGHEACHQKTEQYEGDEMETCLVHPGM